MHLGGARVAGRDDHLDPIALRGLQNRVHLGHLGRGKALFPRADAERDDGPLRNAEPQGGDDGVVTAPGLTVSADGMRTSRMSASGATAWMISVSSTSSILACPGGRHLTESWPGRPAR